MKLLKKAFKLFVYYTFCIIFVCSCVTQKQRERICNGCKTVSIDSLKTFEKIVLKDTTIYVSSDPVIQYIQSPCDTLGKLKPFDIVKYNKGVKSIVKSIGGVLVVVCEVDSLKARIILLERSIEYYRGSVVVKENTTNILTPFQKFCIKFFWTFIGLLVLFCVYKIVRAYFRI